MEEFQSKLCESRVEAEFNPSHEAHIILCTADKGQVPQAQTRSPEKKLDNPKQHLSTLSEMVVS